MKTIFYIVLTNFSMLALCACGDKVREQHMQSLDSLQQSLENLQRTLEETDIESVRGKRDSVLANLNYIKEHYTDTFTREFAIFLADYRSIKKPLSRFDDRYRWFEKETGLALQQVNDLRHDTEHKLMHDSLFRRYYLEEQQVIMRLQQDLENAVQKMETKLSLFDSLNPRVTEVVDSLRSAGNRE